MPVSDRHSLRPARVTAGLAGVALAMAVALALSACTVDASGPPSPGTPPSPPMTSLPSASAPAATVHPPPPVVQPSGAVEEIASGLDAPWSVVRLPNGAVLVSERDLGRIVEVLPGGLRTVIEVPGVVPAGEGGLLGLAVRPGDGTDPDWLYAYLTAADDNRIVRMRLGGTPGAVTAGAPEPVLTGIPKAGNHNGGRLAFGPDGFLYATAGDAGSPDASRDPASLAGKILRMTPTGAPAPGNPWGTHVWTIGHRNPQGLAWDATGRLWAAEFGQNTWDELNLIRGGGDYGWPLAEGITGDPRFVDPLVQWSTADASPSGLAVVGDTLFLAALRGERLWSIAPASADATGADAALVTAAWFTGEYGRLRDAVAGPDGELWVLTNNTDGRGDPSAGDDRLLRIVLQ